MSEPIDLLKNSMILHKLMVEHELQRSHPERHRRSQERISVGFVARCRRIAGKGLIALGTRIDPSSIRADHPAPISA
jgi:hypothetical protein